MDNFSTQEFQNKVSELIGKSEALQQFAKDTPTDWGAIIATFGAALFGALAAFAFNGLFEFLKERERRRGEVNAAINNFVIILNSLLPFKDQFLTKFDSEFDLIREHAAKYHATVTRDVANEFRTQIIPALERISQPPPLQTGAFLSWEEIEFIHISAPEELFFFTDAMPDSIRIFAFARYNILQISKTITARNLYREKYIEVIASGISADPKHMRFVYEMLDYRKNLQDYVDVAIACIVKSIELIQDYAKKEYPKRKRPLKWVFKDKVWVKYKLPKSAKHLLPDMAKYKDIFEPDLGETELVEQPAVTTAGAP